MVDELETVYLLHFHSPYKHARHYVGWAKSLPARLKCHSKGRGARLMAAASAAGVRWTVAREWEGATRALERAIHDSHHTSRFCPVCTAKPQEAKAKKTNGEPEHASHEDEATASVSQPYDEDYPF